jgi:glucosamine-6-phosphate deaminase
VSRELKAGELSVRIFDDVPALARAAAADGANVIREAIDARGAANVMLATGNSQLEFLAELVKHADLDWSRVTAFHMDEYVDLPPTHSASFQRYMRERVAAQLPFHEFHYLTGNTGDAPAEAARYATLLRAHPLDLCCCGIGENGHLAFNDPPVADFDDPLDVKIVALEPASRRQQVAEGHFATVDDVPTHAITVTIPALLRARSVLAIVPEARKAVPVRDALQGPISTACPASVLRRQSHAILYLDAESSSLLDS